MIRYVEFKDADGTPGMIGQRVHGDTARDTFERKLESADKHLLHHVRAFGWTDVLAYDPKTPLPDIMKLANEILDAKGMPPKFDDDDLKRAHPDFEQQFVIFHVDATGKVVTPVEIMIGPDHTETRMAVPVYGKPMAPDDPNHPLIKRVPAPAPVPAV